VFPSLKLGVAALLSVGLVASAGGAGTARAPACPGDVFFSDGWPTWSPDGRHIAFVRTHIQASSRHLRVVGVNGRDERPLTGCLVPAGFETELQWSPDGGHLLYETGGTIRVVRADGSGARAVARGSQSDWSPDGRRIAFTHRGSVYVIRRDGSGRRRAAAGESPDWSPDGTQIVFERNGVRVVGADGGGQRRIARGSNPAWSPKGDLIAAVEYVLGQPVAGHQNPLVVFRPDGGGRRVLSRYDAQDEVRLHWSPDGKSVGFGEDGIFEILRIDGKGPRYVPVRGSLAVEWSPDGTRLVAAASSNCYSRIAVLPLDSRRPRFITNDCELPGTARADRLVGTPRADYMDGGAGADRINGRGGTDRILGGAGPDRVAGGESNDLVAGSAGNDVVLGGRGDDELGSSEDGSFDDSGNDRLEGGLGADFLSGAAGRDVLVGGPGRDALGGGDGADVLIGGPGNDWLYVDVAEGDLGDDGRWRDRVRCGPGYDRVKADRLDVVARDCEEVRVWGRPVRRR
jgi:Ca2+-binding RTX toxin-like protein